MRAVNLIPPEQRRGDRAPMRSGPLSYVVIGVLALALAGVYMLVSTGNSISDRKAEVASLEQDLEATQARAQALQSFTGFASLEQARSQTIASLAHSRFDWERVMRELALVIPEDVSLTALSGSVLPSESEGGGSEGIQAPTLDMSGCGDSHESVARFVASLRDIDGVTRVGLSNSSEGSDDPDAAAPAPASGSGSDAECPDPKATSFSIVVAFDGVEINPEGGIVPQAQEALPQPEDGSGVGEAQVEQQQVKDSAKSADQKSNEAVDRYIPKP